MGGLRSKGISAEAPPVWGLRTVRARGCEVGRGLRLGVVSWSLSMGR